MYGESYPMLNNVNILELESGLAVKIFGKTLFDFGANIYLLNKKDNNIIEETRLSHLLNQGKKIINLDFNNTEYGIRKFYNIVEHLDIILDSTSNSFLKKFNVDKHDLVRKFPKLIIVTISGYGISQQIQERANKNSQSSYQNNNQIPSSSKWQINKLASLKAVNKIVEFFKSEENNADNKYINPLIILSDLFGGCVKPLCDIHEALISRNTTGKGSLLDCEIKANLFSLNQISDKISNKDKFNFSCHTKGFDHILFSIKRCDPYLKSQDRKDNPYFINKSSQVNGHLKLDIDKNYNDYMLKNNGNLNFYLKKICERLLIEVINIPNLPSGIKINFTRDYIDYFELITKSLNDSVKYIKHLCKQLDKEMLISQLKKFDFVEIYPISKLEDYLNVFKNSNISLDGFDSYSKYGIKQATNDNHNSNNNTNISQFHNPSKSPPINMNADPLEGDTFSQNYFENKMESFNHSLSGFKLSNVTGPYIKPHNIMNVNLNSIYVDNFPLKFIPKF